MVDPSRLRRPILLVHGREDPIAPIDDVIELAGAAAERGLLIDMVSIDGVGHNFSSPAALVTALGAELDAYDAVLKGSATPS
jgi:dipeptidyl aminopeptidase/acylaminoacyl peptidase